MSPTLYQVPTIPQYPGFWDIQANKFKKKKKPIKLKHYKSTVENLLIEPAREIRRFCLPLALGIGFQRLGKISPERMGLITERLFQAK